MRRAGLALIVAAADNDVIGMDQKIPWHIPADMERFKNLTMGNAVIMGRRTFLSIGRPLPGRLNIVLSRNPDAVNADNPGVVVAGDMAEALEAARSHERVFVIGGEKVYEEFFPCAMTVYLTRVQGNYLGDTVFPAFHNWPKGRDEVWKLIASTESCIPAQDIKFSFNVYVRSSDDGKAEEKTEDGAEHVRGG